MRPTKKRKVIKADLKDACDDVFSVWDAVVEKYGVEAAPHLTQSVMLRAGLMELMEIGKSITYVGERIDYVGDQINAVADALGSVNGLSGAVTDAGTNVASALEQGLVGLGELANLRDVANALAPHETTVATALKEGLEKLGTNVCEGLEKLGDNLNEGLASFGESK